MNESLKLNKTNFVLQTCNIIALKLFLSHFFFFQGAFQNSKETTSGREKKNRKRTR